MDREEVNKLRDMFLESIKRNDRKKIEKMLNQYGTTPYIGNCNWKHTFSIHENEVNDNITCSTTPLAIAVENNYYEIAQYLLERGAEPNFNLFDRYIRDSIITYPIATDNTGMVSLLIKYGLSVDILVDYFDTCISKEMLKVFLNADVSLEKLKTQDNIFHKLLNVNFVSCVVEDGNESVRSLITYLEYLWSLGFTLKYNDWIHIRADYNDPSFYISPGFDNHELRTELLQSINEIFLRIKMYFEQKGILLSDDVKNRYFNADVIDFS